MYLLQEQNYSNTMDTARDIAGCGQNQKQYGRLNRTIKRGLTRMPPRPEASTISGSSQDGITPPAPEAMSTFCLTGREVRFFLRHVKTTHVPALRAVQEGHGGGGVTPFPYHDAGRCNSGIFGKHS
jgi:hypothetical protein